MLNGSLDQVSLKCSEYAEPELLINVILKKQHVFDTFKSKLPKT